MPILRWSTQLLPKLKTLLVSAMGALVLAFLESCHYQLCHRIVAFCFFIPVVFICIGCSHYFYEIWSIGISWVFENVL